MISTVDQIKINSKSTLADIIVGFIRYTENKQLSNKHPEKKRVKNVVEVSEQICKYCKDKNVLEKYIAEFEQNLNTNFGTKEKEYYSDVLYFLKNYTINNEIIENYKNSVSSNAKCGLYEFVMKIGDVFDNQVRYSSKEDRQLKEKHKKSKTAKYENIGKILEKLESDEITFSYEEFKKIIEKPDLKIKDITWWDKYVVSPQSKVWKKCGFQVKDFDTAKKIVTFKRINSSNELVDEDFKLNDEFSEEDIKERKLYEGAYKTILVNKYERNFKARKQCIEHYGCKCMICGFDFEKVYGELGKDFIEVHHLIPLSDIKKEYEVNPIKDLIPVCSNCHSIIHRQPENLDVDVIKAVVNANK